MGILVVLLLPACSYADITPQSVIDAVNQERISTGLRSLVQNEQLQTAAQDHANDMARNSYFAHTSPTGVLFQNRLDSAGYAYQYAGENLAVEFTITSNLVKGWMDSPLHRQNILSPNYTETGVAVQEGMYEGVLTEFVVQMFASPEVKSVVATVHVSATTTTIVPPATASPITIVNTSPVPNDSSKILFFISLLFLGASLLLALVIFRRK